ncbi:MAG: hypothetical protein U5K75_00680 [Ahrensia sp.]|nr:hypothetical protein [Ahrensia sp.]
MLGNALRYVSVFTKEFWSGPESLGFYILYPTLLFTLILKADFSGLALGKIIFALCIGLGGHFV